MEVLKNQHLNNPVLKSQRFVVAMNNSADFENHDRLVVFHAEKSRFAVTCFLRLRLLKQAEKRRPFRFEFWRRGNRIERSFARRFLSRSAMLNAVVKDPSWIRTTLKLAGIYNLAWGAWIVLFPLQPFQLLRIAEPNYPALVQCLGMVIGVYGIGYWIAASDSVTHWPIVFVGLLGKLFGPIGFAWAASCGELPWKMGLGILANDLVWWVPFIAILIHAVRTDHSIGHDNSISKRVVSSL